MSHLRRGATWQATLLPLVMIALIMAPPSTPRMRAAEPGSANPLRFRRIYAPADRVKDWPVGSKVAYEPLPPADFEKLVNSIRSAPAGVSYSLLARVERAHYVARLEKPDLLVGKANLQISYSAEAATLLPLSPCGLAIESCRWTDPPGSPAALGLGADNRLALLVERAGDLQIDWSLRGYRGAAGDVGFALELPPCPAGTLMLDIPAELQPHCTHGVIAEEENGAEGRTIWRIELGGNVRTSLQLLARDPAGRDHPTALVQQLTTYEFSSRGLDVAAELKLDIQGKPLQRLTVRLDEGLQLVSARYGDTELPRSTLIDETGGSQSTLAVLEFPEAIGGQSRTIRLSALAPLPLDRQFNLPGIQPQGLFWQEGSARLLVPAPLSIEKLDLLHCRQTKLGPLAPLTGELIELQHFSPDASASLVVARRRGKVHMDTGLAVDLGSRGTTGQLAARFRLAEGQRFSLEADVAPRWIIDSVTTSPATALQSWNVEDAGSGRRVLSLRLSEPLRPEKPLRVVVSGRVTTLPSNDSIGGDHLKMLTFRGATPDRQLLSVRAAPTHRLRWDSADEMRMLDSSALTEGDRELVVGNMAPTVVDLASSSGDWSIALEDRPSKYAGELNVEVAVLPAKLNESYTVKCIPDGSRIDRLMVHFSQRRTSAPKWILNGEQGGLTAKRLTRRRQAVLGIESGETWELELRQPQTTSFEIRAMRTTKWNSSLPVSLAALPGAAAQQGTLLVLAEDAGSAAILNHRLEPIPPPQTSESKVTPVRGLFRYEPAAELSGDSASAVDVVPAQAADAQPGAEVWSCRVDSRYGIDGAGLHFADFQIENAGRSNCRISMPVGAEVLAVAVNGTPIPIVTDGSSVDIALPRGDRFAQAAVQFTTAVSPLGAYAAWSMEWPKIDLPVLSRDWTLWLPPGYELVGPARARRNSTPLTWSERLFGPLGKSSSTPPFDPFSSSDWLELVSRSSPDDTTLRTANEFLDEFGKAMLGRRGEWTWSELLNAAATASSTAREDAPLIWIDERALAAQGLGPDAKVEIPPLSRDMAVAVNPRREGAIVIESARLALLVDAGRLIVTSAPAAAMRGRQLKGYDAAPLYAVRQGDSDNAERGEGAFDEIRLAAWQSGVRFPWLADDGFFDVADYPGWSAWQLDGNGEPLPQRVAVVRHSVVLGIAVAVLALVLAIGRWWLARRAGIQVIVAGLFAFVALMLPEALAPVASAGLLGSLVTLILEFLIPPRRMALESAAAKSAARAQVVAAAAPVLSVAIIVMGLSTSMDALGADESAKGAVLAPVHGVFIPVDDEGEPTGDRYQVPVRLLEELRRRSAAALHEPRDWLIESASYQATIERGGVADAIDITAVYQLRVFTRRSHVRIPLSRATAEVLPDRAFLDGQPIDLAWEEGGQALLVDIREPGSYRLELAVRPLTVASGERIGFELAVPGVCTSSLELQLPQGAAGVEVPGALGAVTSSADGQRLNASLGPVARLVVRWPRNGGSAGPTSDVEELLWLNVRPGSVIVNATLKYTVVSGQLHQIRLTADRRLQLLPLDGADSPIAAVRTTQGGAGSPAGTDVIELDLKNPVSDRLNVRLSWLLTERSGVGNLRLPALGVLDARATRRWLAVSVDPALRYEVQDADRLEALAVAEYMLAWGMSDPQPQLAYRLSSGDWDWRLATEAAEPQTTSQQSTLVSFRRGSATVRLDCQLDTTGGYCFRHRILAPRELKVALVSLESDGSNQVKRWARDDEGAINIFLTQPVTGSQQLRVDGVMDVPLVGKIPLPDLKVERAMYVGRSMYLYRRPGILIAPDDSSAFADTVERPKEGPPADWGRFVASLGTQQLDAAVLVAISPNEPQVAAAQVSTMRYEEGVWQNQVEVQLDVQSGVLDVMRFEVPANWLGPFEVTPPLPAAIESGAAGQRHLVVRPRSAIRGAYRLKIDGPLSITVGEPVTVPDIVPLGFAGAERLWVLPTQVGLDQVVWETSELTPGSLPEGFSAPAVAPAAYEVYRVGGEQPQARIKLLERPNASPQIHLADIRMAWQQDGSCVQVATFDFQAGGLVDCELRLPEGWRINQAVLDGIRVNPLRLTGGKWLLPLGPDRLPQHLELVVQGRLKRESATWTTASLPVPKLGNLPIRRTLWTLRPPPGARVFPVNGEAQRVTPLMYDVYRAQVFSGVMKLPADVVAAVRPDELANWYREWLRRLLICMDSVERQLRSATQNSVSSEADFSARAIAKEMALTAGRLHTSDIRDELSGRRLLADPAAELWQRSVAGDDPTVRLLVGPDGSLPPIAYSVGSHDDFGRRLLAAIGLGLASLAVGWIVGRPTGLAAVRKWPHLIGFVAGAAWWLWLAPSALGWLWMAMSLAAAIGPAWSRVRDPASTVVPLSSISR